MEALAYILVGGLLVGGGVVLGRWTVASPGARVTTPFSPRQLRRAAQAQAKPEPEPREPQAMSDEAQWIQEEFGEQRPDVW